MSLAMARGDSLAYTSMFLDTMSWLVSSVFLICSVVIAPCEEIENTRSMRKELQERNGRVGREKTKNYMRRKIGVKKKLRYGTSLNQGISPLELCCAIKRMKI